MVVFAFGSEELLSKGEFEVAAEYLEGCENVVVQVIGCVELLSESEIEVASELAEPMANQKDEVQGKSIILCGFVEPFLHCSCTVDFSFSDSTDNANFQFYEGVSLAQFFVQLLNSGDLGQPADEVHLASLHDRDDCLARSGRHVSCFRSGFCPCFRGSRPWGWGLGSSLVCPETGNGRQAGGF
mmetsp:Transcript_13498/g.37050  ORF Transcript_13498/g.37050 Transcript_13498/m.37050 type:complete len:184 (+) Transcript_13498:664-1215(+)